MQIQCRITLSTLLLIELCSTAYLDVEITNTRERAAPVALIGCPTDQNSASFRGSALAPPSMRDAYSNMTTHHSERMSDVDTLFEDFGDLAGLDDTDPRTAYDSIVKAVDGATADGYKVLALGGDHSITYPVVTAVAKHHSEDLYIIDIDAHVDLVDDLDGNRFSHWSEFARIMEDKLAVHIIMVGVREMDPHQREQAVRFGISIYDMRSIQQMGVNRLAERIANEIRGPVYLSLDVDSLDPSCMPGVAYSEPGGFHMRDVITLIQEAIPSDSSLVAVDLVELNPKRDVQDISAMATAKLFKELVDRMAFD